MRATQTPSAWWRTASSPTARSSARWPSSERCKELELRGRSGQLDGAAALLDEIDLAYQHVESELRAALGQARGRGEGG